jgi:acyl transferase domain-containing protein
MSDSLSLDNSIAIIGLGCRFPGGANNPYLFFNKLKQGYDAISPIPTDRWDRRYFHDPEHLGLIGKTVQDKGGFLSDGYKIDEFDFKFNFVNLFNIIIDFSICLHVRQNY